MTVSTSKKILLTTYFCILLFTLTGCTTVKTDTSQTPSPTITISPSLYEENTEITHQDLYEMSVSNSTKVIGKRYKMKLYLEQPPTSTQAEFMTQTTDSWENILITCNMSAIDIAKLDGSATLRREYPSYLMSLQFEDYDADLVYYEASCSLIE